MDWFALLTDDGKWARVWWLDQATDLQVAASKGLEELVRKTTPPFRPLDQAFQIMVTSLDCLCAPSSEDETLPALFRLRVNRDVVIHRDDGLWKVSTIDQFFGELARCDWTETPPRPFSSHHPRMKHFSRFELAAWELWRESRGDQA